MNKYKILFIISLILWIPEIGYSQSFDIGEINGAKYKIHIPENWNGGLVMYAHGYEEIGEKTEKFEKVVDDFMEIFTSRGFAYAESKYKRQGLVVKDGIEDTEALRSYFEMNYGKPDICIVTGHSMGGIISIATIEKYPYEYDGALPLCGWLAPVHSLIKYGFDMLVTYDYLFDSNEGKVVKGEEYIDQDIIQEKLNKKPEMTKLFAEHYRVREEHLAGVISFHQYVLKETSGWLNGLPVGNIQTIYSGFGDNIINLNKDILRYEADSLAKQYYIQYNTPTGNLLDPVIALHNYYDEILPVFNYEYYEQITEIKHTSKYYVQQYAMSERHCEFSIEEVEESFNELLIWIKDGKRPETKYK
jgi:hypothetical protein